MHLPGHLGIGLILIAFVIYTLDRSQAIAFTLFAAPATMLPDIDLLLNNFLQTVHHHGITHTFIFVLFVSALSGIIITALYGVYRNQKNSECRDTVSLPTEVFLFVTSAFLLGSTSHILTDMLSAPDISQPIKPFWPVYKQVVYWDVIPVNSDLWNFGLLAIGSGVWIVAFLLSQRYSTTSIDV